MGNKKKNKTRVKRIVVLTVICLAIIFAITHFSSTEIVLDQGEEKVSDATENKEVVVPDETINIAVIGDIMCHNTQFQDAYDKNTDSYDFTYVLDDVKDYLSEPDLTIGNLETTFAGKSVGYSGYPTFNTPEALGENLKNLRN